MQKKIITLLRKNLSLVVLLSISFVVYAPSLSGDFIIDDIPQVRDNPYIRDIGSIPRYFTKGLWENSALEIKTEKRYLPMTLVPMVGGSGPSHPFVHELGLPVATGGLGYPDTRAHAPNENIRVDLYLKHAQHMERVISEFAK